MLDFIVEFDRLLPKWPNGATWSVTQIAEYTKTQTGHVIEYLASALEREVEPHEDLSQEDALKAVTTLKDRMHVQLLMREKAIKARQEKAVARFDLTMEKVRALQITKNFRGAYRTLSYFVGQYDKDVDRELKLTLYGECLRLGIKAQINLQELSVWFRKGVEVALNNPTNETLVEAFDFVEAYSDYFIQDSTGKGGRLLTHVLSGMRTTAGDFELCDQFNNLLNELQLPPGMVDSISQDF